jgi:hypothetical protein
MFTLYLHNVSIVWNSIPIADPYRIFMLSEDQLCSYAEKP